VQSIVQADALAWLESHPASPQTSVITSLPDRSELEGMSFEDWRRWFENAARTILRWLPHDGAAIFYQSDVRRNESWVDKSHLILRAADAENAALIWHKIVCRQPPDTASRDARPSYSHVLCLRREARAPRHPGPDVLADAGPKTWSRGMGVAACQLACDYLRVETNTRCVVDPFCGQGSALAVASGMGFDVVGVDINARRCQATRSFLERTRIALAALERGAQLFDQGSFFEAHEAWEAHWRETSDGDERRGFQGLIQVAAGFHKLLVMHDSESAQRLLGRALDKLDQTPWLPGFDLARFRTAVHACQAALAAGTFEPDQIPRLKSARSSET
jgi:hypothetical protein